MNRVVSNRPEERCRITSSDENEESRRGAKVAESDTIAGGAAYDVTLEDGVPEFSTSAAPVRPSFTPEPDDVTAEHPGRYDLAAVRELGRGGIGRVVATVDRHLGREVAIKELNQAGDAGSRGSPPRSARFLREARVTGQLEHPNIVPVYELGQRPDGTLYYSMKVVRGRSLGEALASASDLADRLALLDHFRDACEAVAYAHARGVVHRDLKPDNIMVGEFGETMVVDWGLAKVRGSEDIYSGDLERQLNLLRVGESRHTIEGDVLGTPTYMSPEQANGDLEKIDERSDVWSLGAVLYEILTGRPPFQADHPLHVLAAVLTEPPPPVRERCPAAPAELVAIVDRAMSQDREDRYAGASQLAAEIAAWQDGRPVGAYEYSSWELLLRFVRRNRAATLAVVVLVLGSLLASVLIYRSLLDEAAARAVAELESARAQESERRERLRHATMLLINAERALENRDSVAAAVYAAAALDRAEHPAVEPDHLWWVRARSASLQAEGVRGHLWERALTLADRPQFLSPRLSPAGDRLAALVEHRPTIFDLDGDDEPLRFEARARAVGGWTPDGSTVALLDGSGAGMYDVATGERRRALPPRAKTIAFCEDRFFVGLDDGAVLAFDDQGERDERFETGLKRVTLLAAAPDCRHVAAATKYGPRFVIWDAVAGREVRAERLSSAAWSLAFAPDGSQVAVGGEEPRIWMISSNPDHPIDSVAAQGWVHALSWTNHRLFSSESSRDLVVREPRTGRVLEVLHRPWVGPSTLSVGRNGRVAASTPSARAVALWRRVSTELLSARRFSGNVRHLEVSADGERVVVATPGEIWLLEVGELGDLAEAPARRVPLPTDWGPPAGVAITPEGDRFAVVTNYGRVVTGHGASDELRQLTGPWSGHSYPLQAVLFTSDGEQLLASSQSGDIRRWTVADGAALEPLRGHEQRVLGLARSPDGQRLASASAEGTVRIWDLSSGEVEQVLDEHRSHASDVAFSPDGERLLSVDAEGWLRLWRVDDGRRLRAWKGHDMWVNRCDWAGPWLATASDDHSVRLWSADDGQLRRILPVDGLAITADLTQEGRFLYYHLYEESRRLVRVIVAPSEESDEPGERLQRAERRGAVRLVGGELRPIEM